MPQASHIAHSARRLALQGLTLSGLALLLLLAGACGSGEATPAGQQQGPRTVPVEVGSTEVDTLLVRLDAVGTLEADSIVDIRPETSGVVSRIAVTEGQEVRKGQVLVQLEDSEIRAQSEAAAAALSRARTESSNLELQLERNRGLLDTGAISQQTFDDIESSTEAAQARAEEAQANFNVAQRRQDKTVIRAPFSGRVDTKEVYLGDFVDMGNTTLFTLVDADPLKVEFTVPEQFIGRLDVGSSVSVRVRNMPDQRYEGTVVFVSPRVDPVNRTVTLKAEVPNPEGTLRAGQFADVQLVLQTIPDALLVPEAAIVSREGENFVFLVENGKAVRRSVQLGEREPGRVQVVSGLEEGQTVVVAGQQRLQDGASVAPTNTGSDSGTSSDAPASSGTGTGTGTAEQGA
ncbi:MAG: efflux RND transporter periplasmic adaptor subunit [Acidobacteriota bacterium]|nr:efflux RND transporter periplasmic adaptor subunit [Acidobacteriota bacterium]